MARTKKTPAKTAEVKEEIKTAETATPVVEEKAIVADEVVEVEVTPVAETVEEKALAEEKKTATKKTATKKATTKKTATKATTKKTTSKKKVATPVVEENPAEKKTTAKKPAVNVYFQYQGTETAELVEQAKKLSGVKSPKSIKLYIKPEDEKVYYVIDDIAGDFEL